MRFCLDGKGEEKGNKVGLLFVYFFLFGLGHVCLLFLNQEKHDSINYVIQIQQKCLFAREKKTQ